LSFFFFCHQEVNLFFLANQEVNLVCDTQTETAAVSL
jgi:hypothetical protein